MKDGTREEMMEGERREEGGMEGWKSEEMESRDEKNECRCKDQ